MSFFSWIRARIAARVIGFGDDPDPAAFKQLADRSRSRGNRIGRITHCYRCKKSIQEIIGGNCQICGWIICPKCSACGCGRGKPPN